MRREPGFTLIEVLVALTVFALIASLAYAAVGPAGRGFRQLDVARDRDARVQSVGATLRSDVAYASASHDAHLVPLQLQGDARGAEAFDELTLLVREPGRPSLTHVHYYLDETKGELVRESRMAWARADSPGQHWEMGKVSSLSIEAMDAQGAWRHRWPPGRHFSWPRALRIRIERADGMHEWWLPIMLGGVP